MVVLSVELFDDVKLLPDLVSVVEPFDELTVIIVEEVVLETDHVALQFVDHDLVYGVDEVEVELREVLVIQDLEGLFEIEGPAMDRTFLGGKLHGRERQLFPGLTRGMGYLTGEPLQVGFIHSIIISICNYNVYTRLA